MSTEAEETVRMRREAFESFARAFLESESRARAELERFAHPDVVWIEDPGWPGGGVHHGYDGVIAMRADRMDSFDYSQTVEDFFDRDEISVACVRWGGRAQSSGVEAELDVGIVLTWRSGRVSKVEFFLDRNRALAAAGIEA